MNLRDHKPFAWMILIAVLLPAGLGLGLDWPPWTWIVLTVLLVGLVVVGERHVRNQREQDSLRMTYEQEPSPVRIEPQQVRDPLPATALASGKSDYSFLFSCTVNWRLAQENSDGGHGDPRAIAADHIVGRAAMAVAHESPADQAMAQHRLAASLGYPEKDRSGRFVVWADDVVLAVPDEDSSRLRRLAELRKEEELWEQKRGYERNVRAYLGDEVLKNTGSAVVWWLANHREQVTEATQLIGTLSELSAAANNTEVDTLFRHLVTRGSPPAVVEGLVIAQNGNGSSFEAVHRYLPEFDDSKAMFGHQLATLLETHDEPERAERVRGAYNPDGSLSGDLDQPDLE